MFNGISELSVSNMDTILGYFRGFQRVIYPLEFFTSAITSQIGQVGDETMGVSFHIPPMGEIYGVEFCWAEHGYHEIFCVNFAVIYGATDQ